LTAAFQRSVDDIDAWTRAFAKEKATQAGLPVRVWLDRFAADRQAAPIEVESAGQPAPAVSARDGLADARREARDWADDLDSTEPLGAWGPAREAFGQRCSRPDALPTAERAQASAAAILARATDLPAAAHPDAPTHADGAVPDNRVAGELGVRARVSQAPRPRLDIEEVERLLDGPVSQGDGQTGIEPQSALLDVERALREIREEIEAAEQVSETPEPSGPDVAEAEAPGGGGQASTQAIAQLGLDIARLVEVMDCGFDRVEAASARHTLELRREVTQLFDELAARLEDVERRPGEPAATTGAALSPAVEPCERNDEPAPATDALFHASPDVESARREESAAELQSPLPEAAASEAGAAPSPAPALHDPDWDLFEAPQHSADAGSHDPSDPVGDATPEAPAWSADALPTQPAAEVAGQPWAVADTCDWDAELFAPTPAPFGARAAASVNPAELPPAAPTQQEADHRSDGAERFDVHDERAPGWRPLEGWPGAASATLERPFEAGGGTPATADPDTSDEEPVGADGDGAEVVDRQREALRQTRGKSSGFGWLPFGRAGRSRKNAA
jgi:hypothetical protein